MAKKIAILGAGESGIGAAILAQKKGFDVFVSDCGTIQANYIQQLEKYNINFEQGKHSEEKILSCDEVIKSPGIRNNAVDRILSRLHVEVITEEQSNTTWVQTRPTEDHKKLYVDSYTPIHGTIPNVKGMGLKDALYVLRSLDIAVKVVGHGVVKKQSIPPDTQIKKGMSITIELG